MPEDTDELTRTELGRELNRDTTDLSSVLGDAYRGELDRETTWRSRLDQTTTWSVTIMAAILTWAFSSPDNPHYVILVGVIAVGMFLWIEARRYRNYDVYRSRVRLFQQNVLANALDPSTGVEHADWRTELGDDYRRPTLKITIFEAVSNRLRRIYFALLSVLCLSWLFRVTAFMPGESLPDAASIGTVPGAVVLAAVGAFYGVLLVIILWPHEREAKEEFRKTEAGEWKDGE
ncbi:DUF2270 domain-containing protein [Natrarchaeobius halalkaliphilus]|uniref:DUF2270 domain-containing protein n=1 Tax=Natrarchaeobius halalkaliphilus TaxID=1679091 RepID=A0A3N6M0B3_9EURY|nr:DUF2270 domain-containing protein [Natrarchaeobius halalkaliphilus]RQG87974.1 DUF2270 domain-containing protein [Natrarchaeobius halalkaliphilus]